MARFNAALIAVMLVGAGNALAHHSTAMFDNTQVLTLEGEVTEWRWSNPHSYLTVEVSQEEDVVEWSFESTSSALLARQGWRRDSFEPGDQVSVHYNPLRDGGVGGNLVGVTKTDGSVYGDEPEEAAE